MQGGHVIDVLAMSLKLKDPWTAPFEPPTYAAVASTVGLCQLLPGNALSIDVHRPDKSLKLEEQSRVPWTTPLRKSRMA